MENSRPLKFRAWNGFKMIDYFYLKSDGQIFLDSNPHGIDMSNKTSIYPPNYNHYELMQYTGLKDKNGLTGLYEGDIIDLDGIKRGNKYENPNLLKESSYLLIEGVGTKTWRNTEQKAMERGCFYSE